MANFTLKVITPKKVAFEKEVERVIARTVDGDMGILAGHAPLVTALDIGEMRILMDGEESRYFVSGGFVEINPKVVTILADSAMDATDIDIEAERAKVEKDKAKLGKLNEDRDIALIERALKESLMKIRISEGL